MQSTFVGGGGLSRFSSAPATWLEALLEDDDDPLKPDQSLSHLLVQDSSSQSLRHSGGDYPASTDTSSLFDADSAGSGVGFLRQNSSPAEFLGVGSDAYFASFGTPVNYDYDLPSGSGKLAKDEKAQRHPSPKFSVHLMKKEERSLMPGGLDSSLDMEMEKSVEDSVRCSVRAKRGCATHPRSIAERVRRTRISDRIRKLQELVPNMDKQTNTADMLEEAVKYVKHLQKQIQELSEHQGKCKCSVKD